MFPAISLGFTFFFFCVPSYISGVHLLLLLCSQLYLWGSPSASAFPAISLGSPAPAFPAISLGFTFLLLVHSQLYLWGSLFFFLCIPSYISGVSLFFFLCIPSYISGVHFSSSCAFRAISLGFHYSSSCAFPAISLGFTILLVSSQLYLWGSPSSSSSVFPAISMMFTFLSEISAYVPVFNPTIEAVTFCLRGLLSS